jgi:geranylgeranyl reductase family protein
MNAYDAIVVGAGPAGAATALLLVRAGQRVLLLDKERFPRYKACGGGIDGIAGRVLAELGIDIGSVVEDTATDLRVTYQGRRPSRYHFDRPFARLVMRSEFDALMARVAAEAGAEFHDGEAVRGIRDDGLKVTVTTDRGSYVGSVLVGADGAYSLTARTFALNVDPILYFLTEVEAEPDPATQARWAGQSQIDISIWPLGYGWVFPKRNHLSLGSGVPRQCAKDLRPCLERFKARLQLQDAVIRSQRSHCIAFRRRGRSIAGDRVLLVGDAAGLVDPNTGGGIGWALRSACYASQTALSYLSGEAPCLRSYNAIIDRTIGRQFELARIVRNSIVMRFILLHGRATGQRAIWDQVVRVIQGEEEYSDWYARSRLPKALAWTGAIGL